MKKEAYCAWCEREVSRRNLNWFGAHVDVGGELIHCVKQGQGQALVLVHGFMAWSYTWRHNIDALSRRYRVLAPDLRGFGLSEKDGRRLHSIAAYVEVLHRLLDVEGLERATLCGHSMGGEVCMRFALKYPERVEALILVDSTGHVQRNSPPLERAALALPGVGPVFVRVAALNRRFARRTLGEAFHSADRVQDTDVEAYLLPARAPGAASAFIRMVRDMDLGLSAGGLHRLTQQTLVIWGENDPWFPVHYGERLATEIRRSRLVVFPACGHVPQEEHPERFNNEVLAFLERQG